MRAVALVIADLDGAVRAMVGGRLRRKPFNRATTRCGNPARRSSLLWRDRIGGQFTPQSIVVDSSVCTAIGARNYSGGYSAR